MGVFFSFFRSERSFVTPQLIFRVRFNTFQAQNRTPPHPPKWEVGGKGGALVAALDEPLLGEGKGGRRRQKVSSSWTRDTH